MWNSFLPWALNEHLWYTLVASFDFPDGSDSKASAYNVGDPGSISGSGRSPGEGDGNPLQCSCLENLMDGGAWWAAIRGVAKSQTRPSDFTSLWYTRQRVPRELSGGNRCENNALWGSQLSGLLGKQRMGSGRRTNPAQGESATAQESRLCLGCPYAYRTLGGFIPKWPLLGGWGGEYSSDLYLLCRELETQADIQWVISCIIFCVFDTVLGTKKLHEDEKREKKLFKV